MLLHTTSCKNSNEYSLPPSLQLNGKIESITETSYGVGSRFSIQQYATYSKSNEILEEFMLDREGFLDYRIYNGEPTERPLVLNQIIIVLNLYTIDAITYLNI